MDEEQLVTYLVYQILKDKDSYKALTGQAISDNSWRRSSVDATLEVIKQHIKDTQGANPRLDSQDVINALKVLCQAAKWLDEKPCPYIRQL